MSSTNKTSLGLNMWEASDKPVRQDFVNDNVIIDEKITKLNSDLANTNNNLTALDSKTFPLEITVVGSTIREKLVNIFYGTAPGHFRELVNIHGLGLVEGFKYADGKYGWLSFFGVYGIYFLSISDGHETSYSIDYTLNDLN